MKWATNYIKALLEGKTVQFRPRGNSMTGLIESGQLVTVIPIKDKLKPGDIVLCDVFGSQFLHVIKAMREGEYQIANAKGHVNGWIGRHHIYGKCTRVE